MADRISVAICLASGDVRAAVQAAILTHGLEIVLDDSPTDEPDTLIERVSRLRPQIVFLETSRCLGPLHSVVESLRAAGGTPEVVAIHHAPDPEIIVGAMRAGAAEFIYPPYDLNTEKSLGRLLRDREGGQRAAAGKTLGFLSVKGGCGATIIACHVAAELQRSCGKSVLLADFDPDLGVVAFLLKTKSQYSTLDAFQNAGRLDRSIWQAFAATGPYGVSVLGASDEPGETVLDPDRSAHFFRFVRSEYDFTVVDLGRGVTHFNTTAMRDLDSICLVTTMDIPALHWARKTIRTLLTAGYTGDRLRLIVNFMSKRQDVSVAELEKIIDFPVYARVSEDSRAVLDSHSQNGVVSQGSTLGKEVAAIALKLTGMQPDHKEQRRFRLFTRA
jgi:pilus assembly protein CpaE